MYNVRDSWTYCNQCADEVDCYCLTAADWTKYGCCDGKLKKDSKTAVVGKGPNSGPSRKLR